MLSELEVRIFVVLSHKRNMQNHRNVRAEQSNVNRTARFYTWLSRLLLERVTAYCGARTQRDYNEARPVRFEFSDRGGVRIGEVRDYYTYLGRQSKLGLMFNNAGDLDWSVTDPELMLSFPNKMRAGLQLADVAASAFFAGLELSENHTTQPEPAKLLLPRICRDHRGRSFGFGVKLMPGWLRKLPPHQAELIDFYRTK